MTAKHKVTPFGKRLRELRRARNKTLLDLANAAGYSVVHISDMERGRRSPPPTEKLRLMLAELGEDDEFANMAELAAKSRESIEISLKGEKSQTKDMLLALARKCEDGDVDEKLARTILDLLNNQG